MFSRFLALVSLHILVLTPPTNPPGSSFQFQFVSFFFLLPFWPAHRHCHVQYRTPLVRLTDNTLFSVIPVSYRNSRLIELVSGRFCLLFLQHQRAVLVSLSPCSRTFYAGQRRPSPPLFAFSTFCNGVRSGRWVFWSRSFSSLVLEWDLQILLPTSCTILFF